jgi:hypothetical protein
MYWLDQLKQSKRSNILYCISTNSLLSVIPNSSSCCFLHTHRISTGAQYVTLQKYFTHPSLYSYLLVCNPTHKTESGAANWWATTNNKPHGRISTRANQKLWREVRSYYYTLFLQVHRVAVPLTSHRKQGNHAGPKPFSWAKIGIFSLFSSSNFSVQDNILSTAGDALSRYKILYA